MPPQNLKPRKMRAPIDKWPNVGVDDLCKMFGLTRRRVNQLVDEGVITRVEKGQYHLANAVLGYVTFLRDENKNRTKTASAQQLNEAKARLVDAQVEQKTGEIQTDIRRHVASMVTEIIGGLASDLRAVPARVTRDTALRKIIEEEIERVQRSAAERAERRAAGLADDSDGAEAEE